MKIHRHSLDCLVHELFAHACTYTTYSVDVAPPKCHVIKT